MKNKKKKTVGLRVKKSNGDGEFLGAKSVNAVQVSCPRGPWVFKMRTSQTEEAKMALDRRQTDVRPVQGRKRA